MFQSALLTATEHRSCCQIVGLLQSVSRVGRRLFRWTASLEFQSKPKTKSSSLNLLTKFNGSSPKRTAQKMISCQKCELCMCKSENKIVLRVRLFFMAYIFLYIKDSFWLECKIKIYFIGSTLKKVLPCNLASYFLVVCLFKIHTRIKKNLG